MPLIMNFDHTKLYEYILYVLIKMSLLMIIYFSIYPALFSSVFMWIACLRWYMLCGFIKWRRQAHFFFLCKLCIIYANFPFFCVYEHIQRLKLCGQMTMINFQHVTCYTVQIRHKANEINVAVFRSKTNKSNQRMQNWAIKCIRKGIFL